MAHAIGTPKAVGSGRKKGAPNKRTRELIAILDAAGYCPIAELIETAAIAKKEYARCSEIYDAICDQKSKDGVRTPTQDMGPQYLTLIQKSASEIAPYLFPKRKAIEHTGADGKDLGNALAQFFVALDARKNGVNT